MTLRDPFPRGMVLTVRKKTIGVMERPGKAERLGKFGLEVEPTMTKVLEFGRDAARQARGRGERPGTFDFLGFTHYCSRTKDGSRFRMKRVTSGKKFRAKLASLKQWLKHSRIMPTRWILEQVGRKLLGHYAYYGVTDNHRGLVRFYRAATQLLYKWLNRRSQRRSYTWAEFKELLKRLPLPRGYASTYSIGPRMTIWGAVCVNCASPVLRGAGTNQ